MVLLVNVECGHKILDYDSACPELLLKMCIKAFYKFGSLRSSYGYETTQSGRLKGGKQFPID